MKKWLFAVMICVALGVMSGDEAFAQVKQSDDQPANSVPGLFVNESPSFTVSYPKEWVEVPLQPFDIFRAGVIRQNTAPGPLLVISMWPAREAPLSMGANMLITGLMAIADDIKTLYDNPVKLQDGTPGKEVELEFVVKGGNTVNAFTLTTTQEGMMIRLALYHDQGRIADDLKKIAYSIKANQK